MTTEQEFLREAGWDSAIRDDFPADWSTRHFSRLSKEVTTAILMQSVPDHDPRALAGHKIKDFVDLSSYLRAHNIHAPEIFAQDQQSGLLLVEDFGSFSLHDAFDQDDPLLSSYYLKATDILLTLYERTSKNLPASIPSYFESHVHKGRRRLWDWYLPAIFQRKISPEFISSCLKCLDRIESSVPPLNPVFLHGDFHPHNLMILSNGSLGVLDFQGGMIGPAPYDLVNLLRDARRFVPASIQEDCLGSVQSALSPSEWDLYQIHYQLRSFDFHARVIGQAIKLALAGKPKLLSFIPFLVSYLQEDLDHEIMTPLRAMMQNELGPWPTFSPQSLENIHEFIAADAF